MAYAFAFTVIAFGAALLYKGVKGWSWPQFYAAVLQPGTATTAAKPATKKG